VLGQKKKRYRDDKYKAWVKKQPCSWCGDHGDDPHHGIGMGLSGMALTAPDWALMSMCRSCHTAIHNMPHSWYLQWSWIYNTIMKAMDSGFFDWVIINVEFGYIDQETMENTVRDLAKQIEGK